MICAADQLRTPDNNAERGRHYASFILVLYMFWLSFKVYDRTMAGRSRGVLRKKKKKKILLFSDPREAKHVMHI